MWIYMSCYILIKYTNEKYIILLLCVFVQSIDNVCHIKKVITKVSRAIPSSKDILQDQDAAIQPNTHSNNKL